MTETVSNTDDGYNIIDEVNRLEEQSVDEAPSAEEDSAEEEQPAEEAAEEEEIEDRPLEELQTVGLPGAGMRPAISDASGGFSQRVIHVRYAITDNSLRTSSNLPQAKHLRVKLPGALVQWCGGVWVAVSGEDVFIDFFARNDQDGRHGRKTGDVWRWIKVKPSGEFAMGLSRPYTKSMSDGVLVRDYKIAAFKLVVPFASGAEAGERGAVNPPTTPHPMLT